VTIDQTDRILLIQKHLAHPAKFQTKKMVKALTTSNPFVSNNLP
jgi:hypothetical protein